MIGCPTPQLDRRPGRIGGCAHEASRSSGPCAPAPTRSQPGTCLSAGRLHAKEQGGRQVELARACHLHEFC